ncbi:MAG TPA: nuclease [Aliiroseovarius sp.]|nr:nuclease [Aliiroseovarius sp.]
MAKRRRLTPPHPDFQGSAPAPESKSLESSNPGRAPIAHVAADAAAIAAVEELSDELERARREGRMVLSLQLDEVRADFLERDRIAADSEDQAALVASIRARGQQQPIEVQELPGGGYGLISGWRRLLALRDLYQQTGEPRFATVQALLRQPEDQAQAYVAMVEENEMRADLSYFERARIVRRAVATGVFETEKQALNRLFSGASYARRSKIKSFLTVVDALDGALRFPARISERTGLKLARALADAPETAARLRALLEAAAPDTAEQEVRVLERGIAAKPARTPPSETESEPEKPQAQQAGGREIAPGIRFSAVRGAVRIEGPGVNAGLIDRLQTWLCSQG